MFILAFSTSRVSLFSLINSAYFSESLLSLCNLNSFSAFLHPGQDDCENTRLELLLLCHGGIMAVFRDNWLLGVILL